MSRNSHAFTVVKVQEVQDNFYIIAYISIRARFLYTKRPEPEISPQE